MRGESQPSARRLGKTPLISGQRCRAVRREKGEGRRRTENCTVPTESPAGRLARLLSPEQAQTKPHNGDVPWSIRHRRARVDPGESQDPLWRAREGRAGLGGPFPFLSSGGDEAAGSGGVGGAGGSAGGATTKSAP